MVAFKQYPYFFILILAGCVLIPYTGNVHLFDWDEINFAECAREMIVTNSYHTPLLNFQPFWEKPPLFIWIQVISMKFFGINEFAARFPNIINGLITLCLIFYFGKKWYSVQFAWLWALIHLGTMLPHLYFRSGIIDPWYNLLGFIFIAGAMNYIQSKNIFWLILGSISLGFSVLTKGPAMLLIVFLCIFILLLIQKDKLKNISILHLLISFVVLVLSGGSWFLYEYLSGNEYIIKAFFDYQIRLFNTEDSGHGGFFLYHFVVILIGCFPASVLMLSYFSKKTEKDFYSVGMLILLAVVLIIFSIVKTKIVHYSSMAYYSISFLTAYVLNKNISIKNYQKYLLLIIGSIIGFTLILAGNIEKWKHLLIPYLKKSDVFAAENLSLNVLWNGWEWCLGVLILIVLIWYLKSSMDVLRKNILFFSALILWINLTINNFVGKIEQYTQNSVIVFYEFCADKNYLVDTYGFKSYAYLFYGKRTPPDSLQEKEIKKYLQHLENAGYDKVLSYNLAYLNWLIDSSQYPAFLVCKIQDEENVLKTGKFKKLYSRGGYVFFMKQPSIQ